MGKNYFIAQKNSTNFNYTNTLSYFIKKGVFAWSLLLCLISGHAFSQVTYCTSAASSTGDDEIFGVTFATMTNTSTCSSIGGPGSLLNRYNNYTGLTPPVLSKGVNYPLSVTVGMCGSSGYSGIVCVYIDYNQNGLFTDPGENVYTSSYTPFAVSGTTVGPVAGVTIPVTALSGTTRMRVIETESSAAPGPCSTPTWGEVEDYNLTILTPSPLDLGVSTIVKPWNSKICFALDTIVARVRNFGTATVDFSVNPTIVTVKTTGPVISTSTIAITSGTLASNTTQDYIVNTNFNLTTLGTYRFKGYTTVTGDGSALDDTTNAIVIKKPFFTTTISPEDTLCMGIPVQLTSSYTPIKTLGNNSLQNSAYSYPAPYGDGSGGARHQFLYLASELTAAGLVAGNITSLNFNVGSLNFSGSLTNYNISIATTTLTNITAFQTTGFTTYFNSLSYMPSVGINTHSFSTPFVWDGTSNIIVQTCHNNNSYGTANASVFQTATTFTSSVYYYAYVTPGICSSILTSGNAMQRPDIGFGQPVVVNYSWSPSAGLSASNIYNPIALLPASKTMTVTATIVGGCTSYDSLRIVIKPTPNPRLGSDTAVCSLPFVLSSHTTANSFLWSNGTTGSSLNITTPGKYWIRGTNTNGCSLTDTVRIIQGQFPIVTLGPDTAFCQGSTINLYGGNAGSTYLWSTGSTSSVIAVGTVGTYSLVVSSAVGGCKSSDVINITSKPSPTASLVFTNDIYFCPTQSGRPLTEGTPAGGTYIGSGVSGNVFNANMAGQGTYIIAYAITGSNGCVGLGKDTLIVNACVGVEELADFGGLNVYPNPTSGEFTMELNANTEIKANLSITSIDGKLVYNDVITGNGLIKKSIIISDLANGIYYLTIQTKSAIKTYKISKQ